MLCETLRNLGPARARGALGTLDGRRLSALLGMTTEQLLAAVDNGALDQLCATRPGAAGPAGGLAAMLRQMEGSMAERQYDNCKVIVDAAGNTRVVCPEQPTPGGPCACGCCPPTTATQPSTNCLGFDPSFAPCTVANTCTTYKMPPFTASIVAAAPVPGEPVRLFQQTTTTRFVLTVLPVGIASELCFESFRVTLAGAVVDATGIAFQTSALRQNPDGTWVWAWNPPVFSYADNWIITSGRCTCPPGEVCGCQTYNGPYRVSVDLAVAPAVGDLIALTVNTSRRKCGEANCLPCMPPELCGATLLRATYTSAAGTPISAQSYLWGGGPSPQEPVLNYAGPF